MDAREMFGLGFIAAAIVILMVPVAVIMALDHLITHKLRGRKSAWDHYRNNQGELGWDYAQVHNK